MKKYLVKVEEVLTHNVIVEAEDEADAEYKVEQLYFDEKIVLDYNDFNGKPTIKCQSVCTDLEKCTEFD